MAMVTKHRVDPILRSRKVAWNSLEKHFYLCSPRRWQLGLASERYRDVGDHEKARVSDPAPGLGLRSLDLESSVRVNNFETLW